jgi:hypothetical protein
MSLFDLSGVVSLLSDSYATITRYGASPVGVDGRAAAKVVASTISNLAVSFQPAGSKWARARDSFNDGAVRQTMFAPVPIFNGDRVTVAGSAYEVEEVDEWSQIGNYTRALVRKLDPAEA